MSLFQEFSYAINETSNRGFSLLSVMIALGLGGILVATMSKMSVNTIHSVNHAENKQEVVSIRQSISKLLSCGNTLNPSNNPLPLTCNQNTYFRLRTVNSSSGGARYIGKPETLKINGANRNVNKFGKWYLWGQCDSSSGQLVIKSYRQGSDPLTKKSYSAQYGADFFKGNGEFCKEFYDTNVAVNDCPDGQVMTGVHANGNVKCEDIGNFVGNMLAGISCPSGQFLRGFHDDGSKHCDNAPAPQITYRNTTTSTSSSGNRSNTTYNNTNNSRTTINRNSNTTRNNRYSTTNNNNTTNTTNNYNSNQNTTVNNSTNSGNSQPVIINIKGDNWARCPSGYQQIERNCQFLGFTGRKECRLRCMK